MTSYEYDGNSNCLKEVNPIGGITTYSYDSINRLVEVMGVDGNKRSYQYDANGNMTSYTDANQNKWEYEYDALNRRTGMTDKNGGHIAYAYGKKNEVAKITDQEGTETSYRYDSNGRLIGMTDGLENSLDFFYDSLDRLIQQTDARGNSTQYTYSPLGNLLSMKDPMGNMTLYTYNAMGQVLTKTDALGNIISYTHDALGQVISITDAMGDKMQFTYSSSGKIATVTDAIGGITCYKYDGCGNLTQLTDPLGTIVNYEYDAMNNQIKESLSDSTVQAGLTIYQYDKKGRMLREINPLKDEKNYSYDGNDNIISALDEDGNVTKVQYDLNNKPISMSYSDGKEALFRYNKRGELVELKDWNGTTTMEYGKTGKLAKVTDMEGRATNYIYDANGNSTSIVYPDGSTVCNDYDKNNRKTEVIDAEKQVTHYDYDALGNTLSIQQPKNTVTYAYNVKGLPTKVKYQLGDGTFMENSLTYDAIGNIVEEDRKGGTLELTKNVAYTYDPLGQLLSCKEGSIKESYEYDILGNRIAKKLNDSQNASYFYNALNQLTSRTENDVQHHYSYDKRGNLTEERYNDSLIKNYFYDATNHMTMGMNIESGEQSEYIYNGLSMRVKNIQTRKSRKNDYISYAEISDGESSQGTFQKREMSYVTDYLSGVNNELMAYEKGYGTTRVTYGRGYERLSQTVATESATLEPARATIASTVIGKSYFQSNLLGSVLFASNNQGEVLQYAERNSSGELNRPELDNLNIAGLENSIRFTNYDYDSIIDKHFAQARFYDAKQGRMLAKDPVKRGLNAYPYCKNNPVNYVDPTGEIANIALGALLGAGVGGAFGAVGSILSQLNDGGQVNAMEVLGASANGLLLGAARGALISSGAGLALSLATNFAAGAAGSALEQTIGTGTADFRESITSGLINASIGAIYGNGALLSAKDAIIKGAKSGAAGAGISYLSNAWNNRNAVQNGNAGVINPSSFISQRGSNTGCQKANPFNGELGYHSGAGYQYENAGTNQAKQGGFSFVDLTKEIVKSAVVGGMASLFFYGLDQVISSPKNSISSTSSENGTNNKGGSEPIDINLKYKKGWSAENVREADAKLIALSEANTLKTPVNRSGTSARAMYKKAYGNNSIPKGYDVDHIIDIQLGGSTTLDNLAPLNQSVNRSLGAQINNAIKKFPNGTSFGNFTIN